MQQTAFYALHLQLGARTTDFHGWEMPLYYSSILEEHKSVRTAAGLFDISHMGQILVTGAQALETLNRLVVSELSEVGEGRACYTMLTNERGGILDDLLIYHLDGPRYLVIVNCSTRQKDYDWLLAHRLPQTDIRHISEGRSIIAIQGPQSGAIVESVLRAPVTGLNRFSAMRVAGLGEEAWVSRTGYTGSDGFELFLLNEPAVRLWTNLLERGKEQGLRPVGLGARDTLRLEAGLRLYGTDMDETTTPYEADLGWTVAVGKPSFLGKDVLAEQKLHGVLRRLVGFELAEGPVPRHDCPLTVHGEPIGRVTSGTFSLMLNRPIGMGYVKPELAKPGTQFDITIRNQRYTATVVKMPFWRPSMLSEQKTAETNRLVKTS